MPSGSPRYLFNNWEIVSRGTWKSGHKASSILRAWAVLAVAQGRDVQTARMWVGWGLQPGLSRDSKFRKVFRNQTGSHRDCPYCP